MNLQRYSLIGHYAVLAGDSNYLLPAPEGEWVRFEDVEPFLMLDVIKRLDARISELTAALYGGDGYGAEVIDVVSGEHVAFTSYRGDPCWDTPEQRRKVREHHARMIARVASLEAADDEETTG